MAEVTPFVEEDKMFETKKAMKRRIEALEEELNAALAVNRLADRCGLSECKGIVCKKCEHAVFVDVGFGGKRLVGCDVTVNCPDYKPLL